MPQALKRFPSKMDPKAERSRGHLSRDPKGSGPNSNVCQEGAGVPQHQGILGSLSAWGRLWGWEDLRACRPCHTLWF